MIHTATARDVPPDRAEVLAKPLYEVMGPVGPALQNIANYIKVLGYNRWSLQRHQSSNTFCWWLSQIAKQIQTSNLYLRGVTLSQLQCLILMWHFHEAFDDTLHLQIELTKASEAMRIHMQHNNYISIIIICCIYTHTYTYIYICVCVFGIYWYNIIFISFYIAANHYIPFVLLCPIKFPVGSANSWGEQHLRELKG